MEEDGMFIDYMTAVVSQIQFWMEEHGMFIDYMTAGVSQSLSGERELRAIFAIFRNIQNSIKQLLGI